MGRWQLSQVGATRVTFAAKFSVERELTLGGAARFDAHQHIGGGFELTGGRQREVLVAQVERDGFAQLAYAEAWLLAVGEQQRDS